MPDGIEPVDKDEIIYRRVYVRSGYWNPAKGRLSPKAFKPLGEDTDGISVTRAGYVTGPQDAAALGFVGKDYYIIEQRAGDLQQAGLTLVPSPNGPDDLGHAVIPEITITRGEGDPVTEEWMVKARDTTFKIHGPFPGTKPPPQR